jgi:anti-anti-sigma factor
MPQASVLSSCTAASRYPAPVPFVCAWKAGGSGAAWVHVAGELDLATVSRLRHTLGEAQSNARLVVLDLRELTFMDSAGIHAILDAATDARQAAGRLILVRGPAPVDRILTLTGACEKVEIFDLDPAEPPALALLHLAGGSTIAS